MKQTSKVSLSEWSKEPDLKSGGLCPHRFEPCGWRHLFAFLLNFYFSLWSRDPIIQLFLISCILFSLMPHNWLEKVRDKVFNDPFWYDTIGWLYVMMLVMYVDSTFKSAVHAKYESHVALGWVTHIENTHTDLIWCKEMLVATYYWWQVSQILIKDIELQTRELHSDKDDM